MQERRTFGNTGLRVSPLGFGAAPIGLLETDREAAARCLNLLLDGGVNVIDTAASYNNSEEVIGQAIGHRRGDYVLISKCGRAIDGIVAAAWSAQLIAESVDRSLKRLRTDHLDVMLLHSCDLDTLKRGEALGALEKARKEGKTRFIGYSGDNAEAEHAAGLPQVDVLEMSVSVCDQANLEGALPRARDRGLAVIAKRPLANAAWKPADAQKGFYVEYARPYSERLQIMGLSTEDLGFKQLPEDAWPEIALRFALSHPGVHTAIAGTTNADHALKAIGAAALGPLPDETAERIRAAFRKAASAAQGGWPALT